jgi:hypothetical protein
MATDMSTPARIDPTVALAVHVAARLQAMGVDCALIGGGALAVYGYPRATVDLDLAVAVDPLTTLRPLANALRAEGYDAAYEAPDEHDVLGGVLSVSGPDTDPVQVVNFVNMLRARNDNPGATAIRTALPMADLALRVVDLPHLIALKLWAGGPKSERDVLALIDANDDLDVADVEAACDAAHVGGAWRALLAANSRGPHR